MTAPKLELVPPAKPLTAPRGPMLTSQQIVERFFTDDAQGALVSDKWVRANVPGKIRLSHSKVVWYRDDVLAWIESRKVAV